MRNLFVPLHFFVVIRVLSCKHLQLIAGSRWVGFDFDAITGHAESGISDDELQRAIEAAQSLDYVTTRRSTSGNGYHLYVQIDSDRETSNHTAHAVLARAILNKMSADTGYDFKASADACGVVLWQWSSNANDRSFELIQAAKRSLSDAELPEVEELTSTEIDFPNDVRTSMDSDDRSQFMRAFRAVEKLSAERAKDYKQWIAVLLAIQSTGLPREVAHAFSSLDPRYDPGETNAKLDSLQGSAYDPVVALASLEGYAEQDQRSKIEISESTEPKKVFRRLTSAELADHKNQTKFAIEGILVELESLIIAGCQKTLKTSIALAIALSLVTGLPLFDHFAVRRKYRALVMSGESGLSTLRETAMRICRVLGVELCTLDNLIWSDELPKFGNATDIEALRQFIVADRIEFLFVDPAYLCVPGADAGNLFVQGELLSSVSQLCQELDVTLVLLHHTKKSTSKKHEAPELSDIAWSGFAEFARQWWLIGRREPYIPGTGEHSLWLSVGGSAGHSGLWGLDISEGLITDEGGRRWDVKLTNPSESREQSRDKRTKVDAEQILESLSEPATKTKLRDLTGINATRISSAVDYLISNSSIELTETKGGNGQLYTAYQRTA